ncbi:2-ketoisovalerate ferredoxin oxidoreductase subunit alpha [Desulfurococcus mucosus]|uniref:2-oxoacid oxidoreductase (ferredoxin) n=1 Tax=Desulfurococcus mucosus (strain ATCC 35584 / DSM 2162 / JCM 9187 / O7/1) TaxID=765177 RepID=E8R824_DESM0|nr:2-ketoisovalerate ferredoxin oxidoreductase subunit alpha [Desulfurococcus mucosus]ADV64650.1 pyruvate ferredoxin oxidoreductase, alpha subunit [Desulfurococcus mucosus DSM 2162]
MEKTALKPKIPLEKQVLMTVNGDEAVAYAVKQSYVDVVAAYPITPQTIIVEKYSEFVNDGLVHTEFVPVESEHSAMSACVGAAAAGARAFTATSSQGLALMVEIVYIASAMRLPIVMAVVNRALSAPINIHNDHSDAYLMRDSGWIQLFVENVQEAYDTTIQAFKIAEDPRVQLPVAVNLDGFFLSHTLEEVYMLPDDEVYGFLGGPRKTVNVKVDYFEEEVPFTLNPARPISLGSLDLYDYYFEHKVQQVEAMKAVPQVVREVNEEWYRLTGRRYGDGVLRAHWVDDADIVVVAMGSGAGTVRSVVRKLREKGERIGLLQLRMFRPFPYSEVAEKLSGAKLVVVMDKAIGPGAFGALYEDVAVSLYDSGERPMLVDYIYGLGGRDLQPSLVYKMIEEAKRDLEAKRVERKIRYLGVRE